MPAWGLWLLVTLGSIPIAPGGGGVPPSLGFIDVKAPTWVSTTEVLETLGLHTGDPFSPRLIDRALKRLYLIGDYDRASIEGREEGGRVALLVTVVPRPRYAGTRCTGDPVLSPSEVEALAGLRPGDDLTSDRPARIGEIVARKLTDRGYFEAQVDADLVPGARPGDAWLRLHIKAKPRATLSEMEVLGDPVLPSTLLMQTLGLHAGDPFDRERIAQGIEALRALYRDHRYWQADIPDAETAYDPISNSVRLFVRVEAGDRVAFRVEELGRASLLPDPVLTSKALDVTELDRIHPLDAQAVDAARDRLQAYYQSLGYYFAKVQASFDRDPERRVLHVSFTIDPGPLSTLREVRFEGLHALRAADLQSQMRTRPWSVWGLVADFSQNGFLVDRRIDADVESITALYERNGFLHARVAGRKVEGDPNTGDLSLTLVVDEGVQTRVRAITVAGGAGLGEATTEAIGLRVGSPFNPAALEEAKRTLLREELHEGYLDAEVTSAVEISDDGTQAAVQISIDEGARSVLGDVLIRGTDRTHTNVLRREVVLHRGDPLDPEAILRTQQHIARLGIFDSVRITPIGESDRPRDLLIRVRERNAGAVEFGGGYGTLDGVRGFAEVSHANMRGEAERLSVRGEGGLYVRALWPTDINREWPYHSADATPSFGRIGAGYRWPSLLWPGWPVRLNLSSLFDQRLGVPVVVHDALLGLDHEVGPHVRVSPQYRVSFQRSYIELPGVLDAAGRQVLTQDDQWVGAAGSALIRDTRDDPFNPRRGNFEVLEAALAHPVGGSHFPFLKLSGRSAFFQPLVPPLTGLLVLRGGWARLLDRPGLLPFYERFRLGGATTVRGFQENGIGPSEAAPPASTSGSELLLPRGGNVMASYSVELGFPIPPGGGLSGALFTDGGGVWDDLLSVESGSFRTTAGFGVRYQSPVGPLRADVGFKLDQKPGEPLTNFHFSIGQVF